MTHPLASTQSELCCRILPCLRLPIALRTTAQSPVPARGGLVWTPSQSTRISASLTATSSTVATTALALPAPTRMSPPPLVFVVVTSRAAIDHAMSCNALSGSCSCLHDHCKEALSRVSARAGGNARTEPSHTSVGVAAAGRQGARVDIEVTRPPPHDPTLLDIAMIHPHCSTYAAAASQTRSAAAALRDRSKCWAHAGHLHPGHTFMPASVETYGHLGRLIMRSLRTLSDAASARSLTVTRGSFLASALGELSVALVQSQGYVYHSCALLLAQASGRQVLPGADTPFLD
jgi:hypothetical protein